ncbi:unnamed protein product [Paramecium primaurelia]|uniref:Uncharacterized protein n=1 Tax=Paramecium primaurelia TaxID=5886 RepID=A0A8S1MBW9_PARPR|nr:unnamed protein product [Paramecium primaurelia]
MMLQMVLISQLPAIHQKMQPIKSVLIFKVKYDVIGACTIYDGTTDPEQGQETSREETKCKGWKDADETECSSNIDGCITTKQNFINRLLVNQILYHEIQQVFLKNKHGVQELLIQIIINANGMVLNMLKENVNSQLLYCF